MNVQTPVDPTNDLVEQARRVLPGGSFGNMPAEVILKEAGAATSTTRPARSMSTSCWAPVRCSSAMPIPR